MVSPDAMAKIRQIYAEADTLGDRLDLTPPAERATVVRSLLLRHCVQLREIIDSGTTHADGIPTIEILRTTQRLMSEFRKLRSHRLN